MSSETVEWGENFGSHFNAKRVEVQLCSLAQELEQKNKERKFTSCSLLIRISLVDLRLSQQSNS